MFGYEFFQGGSSPSREGHEMLRNGDSHYGRPGTFQLEKAILEVEEEPRVPAQSLLKAFDIRLPSSHHLRRAQGTGSTACTEGELS